MAISPLSAAPRADEVSFEALAANSSVPEQDRIAEAARQFEAILLRQILQAARQPVIFSEADSDSSDSASLQIYRDMVTDQLAESISRSGSFGLARSLQLELGRQAETPPVDSMSKIETTEKLPATAPAAAAPNPHD